MTRAARKANPRQAIKGAGAGFGIITEFKFRTHPEPGSIVQYSYSFNFGLQEDMAPAYQAWQNLVADPNLDRRFSSQFIVQPLGAIIYATFYGTEAEYQATGIPARLPKPGQTSVVVNDWLGSLLHEAENEALWLADLPTPFYSKSLGLRQQDLLTSQGIVDFFRWLDTANKGTIVWFIIFDQAGGAINDVPKNATAYPHRDKLLFYQSYAVGLGTLSQETRRFLTDVHENIKRAIPGGCAACGTYVGYVDPALGAAAQATYWESNLPRLMQIKSAWDPKDVFRNPGSVRPA